MPLKFELRINFSTEAATSLSRDDLAGENTPLVEKIVPTSGRRILALQRDTFIQIGCTALTAAIAAIICIPGLSNWADSLVANFGRQEQQFTKRINGMLFTGKPNVDGAIAAIRFGEGTLHSNGHRQLVYGGLTNDLSKHPFKGKPAKCAPIKRRQVCSTAAGLGQFLESTWNDNAFPLNITDFSEESQLRVMIRLLDESGAIAPIKEGNFDEALPYLCPIWASIPCYIGDRKGAYNQNVKPWSQLEQIYRKYGGT